MSNCPQCSGSISAPKNTQPGELIKCADCDSELEVISIAPLDLVLAPEIEEDWGE